MFKLVVLSALVAVAMAAPKPGVVAAPLAYSAPVVAHSTVVGRVPTSVSSHSSTVVHSHAVHAVPAVVAARTVVAAPAVHTVHAAPVVSAYSHGLINGHVAHVAAPVVHSAYGVHGVHVL